MPTRDRKRRKTAILISGRGSNMASLIDAAKADDYPAEITIVIANRPDAAGIDFAKAAGIATRILDHTQYDDRESFEAELTEAIESAGADLVCLAGFLRLLTDRFVAHWYDRLINIHPSLLPSFKGLDSHARAIAAGVRIAGCSVHYVRAEMDAGPIIAQAAVPVKGGDTADTLAARVLKAEHKLYPRALALVAAGRARAVGEKVVIDGEEIEDTALYVPLS